MDESEDNMSTEDVRSLDSPLSVKNKPKKRSLVERELETNLTARVTSPVTSEGTNTSRYGRARRLKTEHDLEAEKVMKPLRIDTKAQPQAYKMHASNSPIRKESPKRAVSVASSIENQIENIYNENMSLSRFGAIDEAKSQSPAKKFTKIYIRKDLIQKPDTDTVVLIKNMFSPVNKSTHLNNILERSSEKYSLNGHGKPRNGFPDTSSVVKTLDFDGKKKKKETKDKTAKNELFEMEASCDYQVGDLAWARVGTYPFWPCIVTREPFTDMFVKKKLFGRVEHDVVHVTFFGDNGRRGWIVDNMLRAFHGRPEFEGAREKFTPEAKKKDPRLYAAHFVSEKKLPLWNVSVDEAETLMREPKRLRIDILHDMLEKARASKTTPKREKSGKITRTDSDVSLSESLYDTLFSEDDGKADESKRPKKSRNKSLDVSEVVTACLDNMAAKSGIIKIQKQSHMDRWLQKAKSKTPEKTQPKIQVKIEREKRKDRIKKKSKETRKPKLTKNESLSSENLLPYQNEHDYSSVNYENHDINDSSNIKTDFEESGYDDTLDSNGLGVIAKVETLADSIEDYNQDDIITTIVSDDIVMNDLENENKFENREVVNVIPEKTEESALNSNACNLGENSISSIKNEQVESKVELPPTSNYGFQTRRSKRKRKSDIGKNNSIIENNETDASKLELVKTVASTDMETTLSDRNIVNSNTDHKDNLLDRDKKDTTEPNLEINTKEPVALEVGKDTSIQNKDVLLQLSGPKEVVGYEPVIPEAVKDTSEQIKERNHSDLPLSNILKAVVVTEPAVSEVVKDKSEQTKELNQSDLLPLNGPTAVSVIEPAVAEVGRNQTDLLPLNGPTAVVVNEPSVVEVVKHNSKQIKERNRSDLLPLNGPRAVVVIEPLKMEALEYRVISNEAKQKEQDAKLCNIKKGDVDKKETALKVPKVDTVALQDSPVAKDVDNIVLHNTTGPSLETDAVEPATKNVTVQDVNINIEDNQSEILHIMNKKVLNANSHYATVNGIKTEEMDIDGTILPSFKKDQSENIEAKSNDSNNADSTLPPSKLEKGANDIVEPLKTATNVVIGEEMYLFDRTLSQDYDEIDPDKCNEMNSLAISQINEEITKNDSNYELNNGSKYKRTLSPDYDEVNGDTEDTKTIEKGNLSKDVQNRESANEINTETGNGGAESKSQFFYKNSVHKSKEKTDEQGLQAARTSSESVPMLNGDGENISGEISGQNNKKETEKREREKNRKSSKLSLNKLKNEVSNENINDLLKEDTKSPKSNLLAKTSEQNKVSNLNIKDNTNETNGDTYKGMDFEMLIDMEATKPRTPKINGIIASKESSPERKLKEEFHADTASVKSEDSGVSITRRKVRSKEKQDVKKAMDDPEFLKYLEFRQDALIDEHPELNQDEIVTYLYQTWLYEESHKSDRKKTDDVEQSNLVKGLNQEPPPQPKKIKKKPKVEKETNADIRDLMLKEKPKRKATQSKPYYNEEFSDLEEEDLETFSIFDKDVIAQNEDGEEIDEVELYFEKLTKPKPNVFKGFVREKVCEICETTGNLVKCKSCHGTFHVDCVKNEEQIVEVPAPTRGRKKKKKPRGRRPKGYDESLMDSESQSDEKSQDANISEELNMSLEDEQESHLTVDAAIFEAQLELKMKELQVENADDFASDQEIQWDAPPGQCEIVDVKHKEKPVDYSDYKCNNCEKYDTPICFVCKSNKSPKTLTELRQKCQVAHCHRYYHLECLEYWPQTQFNSWEPSKTNKKVIEYIEALSCPRHVCHTCVSDDPRGCKTRFSGDKLARCVKCPATYHSFTKCLPAGTQILTGSQIICPRHYEHRTGKVPCHVNTGWCFICALGGTLICCEYCPTSFHAECLNIKPPEGSYMCEDCETGRLPLYGEMVWVKLGHYRWWPGIVLHPTEIPSNIMAVKHSPGEFVVRFFGQYDHYWVNRGRVFPFQEGDSGKISSQKSKIDAAFTTAMEHAQRACEILKNVEPNEEEEEDIASSLLPPHYVKLKANKPAAPLAARRDLDAHSLTQCDCDPQQPEPCGPYSHCLNRMLLTECGPLCRAGERCNNRAFERRLYPRLAAYRTPQRGWGLRTLEDIKQGQFVIEYVGELIDEEEFRRRMCRKHEIRDENFYFLTLDKERMIDAGPKGNLARFMNHCCEPNCETQKWTVLGDVRVGLFALRDIPANSEVTFNYNLECAGIEKKRCLCGAKRCSGYIGAKPKQEEAQPKKLKGPGKRTYKKRKHVEDTPSTSKTKPPSKIKIAKTAKPRELTEIEKDLLIIKSATNGMSSDSDSRLSVEDRKDAKALKRKRVSFSTEEVFSSANVKRIKLVDGELD